MRDLIKEPTSIRDDSGRNIPRAQSVGRREEEPTSPLRDQPLTLAYTIHRGQQQLLSLLRTNRVDINSGLKDSIGKVFDTMSVSLKDAAVSFELGKQGRSRNTSSNEFLKTMGEIDGEFAQARQTLRLSNKLVGIQLDKLELGLNALKNSMRSEAPDYSRFNTYLAGRGGRSSSQSNRERAESAAGSRVAGLHKELAKLVLEVKKVEDKTKTYEDLFARKDAIAQSLLSSYKETCDSQSLSEGAASGEQLARKDEEIRKLRADIETREAEARRPKTRLAVRPVESKEDSGQLDKVCFVASTFLNTMEKLKRIIIKKDEANIERTRQELEAHRKALSSLVSSSRSSTRPKTRGETTATSENSIQEILLLQKKRRELEIQCERQGEETAKYQNSLADMVEKLKRKEREIETLQQEVMSYRDRLQTLQEELGRDRELDQPIETLTALPILESVKESAASLSAACEGLEKSCDDRLTGMMRRLRKVQGKIAQLPLPNNQGLERENEMLRKQLDENEKNVKAQIREEVQEESATLRNALETQKADAKDYISQMVNIMNETFQKKTEEFDAILGEKGAKIDAVKESFESVLGLLSAQINEQVESIEQLREENEALKLQQIAKPEGEVDAEIEEGHGKNTGEVQELTDQVTTLKEALSTQERLVAEKDSALVAAEDRATKAKRTQDEELDEEKQKWADAFHSCLDSQTQMGDTIGRISESVDGNVRSVAEAVEAHGRTIEALKSALAKLRTEANSLSTKARMDGKTLRDIRSKLNQKEGELLSLQTKFDSSEETVGTLQADLGQMTEKRTEAEGKLAALEKDMRLLKSQCELKESEIEELTTVKKVLQDELEAKSKAEEQGDDNDALIEQLQSDLATEKQKCIDVKKEKDKAIQETKRVADENWKLSEDMYEKDALLRERTAKARAEILQKVRVFVSEFLSSFAPVLAPFHEYLHNQFPAQLRLILLKSQSNSKDYSVPCSILAEKTATMASEMKALLGYVKSAHQTYSQDQSKSCTQIAAQVWKMTELVVEKDAQSGYLLQDLRGKLGTVSETTRDTVDTLAQDLLALRKEYEKGTRLVGDSCRAAMKKLCEENKGLKAQIAQLTGLMEGKGKELGVILGEKEGLILSLNQRLSALEEENGKIRGVNGEKEKQVVELRGMLEAQNKEILGVKDTVAEVNAESQQLQQELDQKMDEYSRIFQEKDARIAALIKANKHTHEETPAEELRTLREESARLEQSNRALSQELSEAQKTSKQENEKLKSDLETMISEKRVQDFKCSQLAEDKQKLAASANEYIERIGELEAELQQIRDDNEQLSSSLSQMRGECENRAAEQEMRVQTIKQLEEEILSTKATLERAKKEIQAQDINLAEAQQECGKLKADLEKAKSSNEKTDIEIQVQKANEERILALEKELSDMKHLLEKETKRLIQDRDTERENGQRALMAMEEECEALSKEIALLSGELEQARNASVTVSLGNEGKIRDEQAKNEELAQRLRETEEKCLELEAEVEAVKHELEVGEIRLAKECEEEKARSEELLATKKDCDDLKSELEQMRTVNASVSQGKSDLECQLQKAHENTASLEQENKKLSGDLASEKAESERLSVELLDTQAHCKSLEQETGMLKTELQNVSASTAQQKSDVENQLQEENGKLLAQLEIEKSNSTNLESEYKKLGEERASLSKKLAEDAAKLAVLVKENEEAKAQCQAMSVKFEEVKKERLALATNIEELNTRLQSSGKTQTDSSLDVLKSRLLPAIANLHSDFMGKLSSYRYPQQVAESVARIEDSIRKFCAKLKSGREKDRVLIQNYRVMIEGNKESVEKYQSSLQQAGLKLGRLEQELTEAKNILRESATSDMSSSELIPLAKHLVSRLSHFSERREEETAELKLSVHNAVAAMNSKMGDVELNVSGLNVEMLRQKVVAAMNLFERMRQDASASGAEIVRSRTILLPLLQYGDNEGKSLSSLCESVRGRMGEQSEEIRLLEAKCESLAGQKAELAESCMERLRFGFDEMIAGLSYPRDLSQLSSRLDKLHSSLETLQNDRGSADGLKQTLANAKTDLNSYATRLEEKAKEVQELTEIIASNAKVTDRANEDLVRAIEDFGITLDEQQKCSLDELVKTILSLMEMMSKKGNEGNRGEGTDKDELVLDDEDFNVGLVEDLGSSSGVEGKASQRSLKEEKKLSSPPPVVEQKKEEAVVTIANESILKAKEQEWKEKEEKLQKQIEDLQRNGEVKDDSDRLWHVEYEEIKEGIKRLMDRHGKGVSGVECTIVGVESLVDGLAEEIDALQKERENAIQEVADLNQKIQESSAAIERMKLGMGQSQKDLDERKKAVITLR